MPLHLIGPPEALRLFDGWGWAAGLQPDPAQDALPMRDVRDMFLRATSAAGPQMRADGS
ncbi:hypothetical protein [Salipiger sp. CCB-MM3]|uniref:hypothetical protein n=1 Tax=Salipiger sp. CCB-MM3 TaxID=1792508 RepID=UPI001F21D17A|nr:hypothetical protein [Salipiger sp. CCB-MM3]